MPRVLPSAGSLVDRARDAFLRTPKTKTLLKGSALSLALRAAGIALRFAVGLVLARLVGASGYGVYSYAVTWLGVLSIPSLLGLDNVVVRHVAAYREKGAWGPMKGLLRFSGGLGLAAGVGVAAAAVSGVALLPGIGAASRLTLAITLCIVPLVVLSTIRQSALRGLDRPGLAQLPDNILYPLILLAEAAALWWLLGDGLTVPMLAAANAAAWLASFLVGSVFLARSLPRQLAGVEPAQERAVWMEMVPPLVYTGVAYQILSRADVLALGLLATPRDVGVYVVAARVAELMLFAYDALGVAGASLFSSIHATGNRAELQRFTTLVTTTIAVVGLPVCVGLMIGAPALLSLFGAEFVDGATALRILVAALYLSSLGGFSVIMLYMTGHVRDVAVGMTVAAVVNVALSFALIPPWGIVGAAVASGCTVLTLKALLAVALYRRVGVVSLPFGLGARRRAAEEGK